MKDELFNELAESVRQGGAILRGEARPARTFTVDMPDVRGIRTGMNLSQGKFASLLGISVATLRNWEQGRRVAEGPARVLLQVVAKHPEAIWDAIGSNCDAAAVVKIVEPSMSETSNEEAGENA